MYIRFRGPFETLKIIFDESKTKLEVFKAFHLARRIKDEITDYNQNTDYKLWAQRLGNLGYVVQLTPSPDLCYALKDGPQI